MASDPLTPEDYAKLLQLGTDNAGLENAVRMQMAQAQYMRPQPLEMRGNSRVQRAPHWMELIGNLAREKATQNLIQKSVTAQQQQVGNSQLQNQMILRALMARNAPPTIPAPTAIAGPGLQPGTRTPFSLGGDE